MTAPAPLAPLCPRTAVFRRPRLPGLALVLAAAIALALPAAAGAQDEPSGRISGRIVGATEGAELEGTRVVLLQFRLDEEGVPKSSPVEVREADAEGRYTFEDVPIDNQAIYQIGTRFNGRMVGSETFTFPEGETEVKLDVRIPEVSTDTSGVRIEEALIAVEPQRGAVWVTEVVHLLNPTGNEIEGQRSPLELTLPQGAERLEMLRLDPKDGSHKRVGPKLLVYGNLPPGRNTVAFRYHLPVALGSVTLDKRYPYATGTMTVLVPEGNLSLDSDRFNPHETQTIQGNRYDAWVTRDLPATAPLSIELSGVPARQEYFLVPIAAFLLVMGIVVAWFIRRRLRSPVPDQPRSAD